MVVRTKPERVAYGPHQQQTDQVSLMLGELSAGLHAITRARDEDRDEQRDFRDEVRAQLAIMNTGIAAMAASARETVAQMADVSKAVITLGGRVGVNEAAIGNLHDKETFVRGAVWGWKKIAAIAGSVVGGLAAIGGAIAYYRPDIFIH